MTGAPGLWLADELWLITHDDQSGGLRLHAGATGLGLAAALLGELLMFGHLDLQDCQLYLVDPRAPGNALSFEVLDQIRAELRHPLPMWLAYLGRDAEERIAQRMCRSGYLLQTRSRSLLRTVQTYAPVDANTAAWSRARLHLALSRQQRMGQTDTILAGLTAAIGLSGEIAWGGVEAALLHHLVSRLPAALRELLAVTEAAVGDATLTHHRT